MVITNILPVIEITVDLILQVIMPQACQNDGAHLPMLGQDLKALQQPVKREKHSVNGTATAAEPTTSTTNPPAGPRTNIDNGESSGTNISPKDILGMAFIPFADRE